MGANMQRQAVPLIDPHAPWIGTGMEHQTARDSGAALIAKHAGVVEYVDGNEIRVRRTSGELDIYNITKISSFKTQELLITNVHWLDLEKKLRKGTSLLMDLLWKMEKWPLVKIHLLPI